MLHDLDIKGKVITADALLTQKAFARFLVEEKHAHYHFTVKNNQPGLFEDIAFDFKDREKPDFVSASPADHEQDRNQINMDLHRPERLSLIPPCRTDILHSVREVIHKKTGKYSREIAYGITSQTPEQADPRTILATNRGHWAIETSCHYIIEREL